MGFEFLIRLVLAWWDILIERDPIDIKCVRAFMGLVSKEEGEFMHLGLVGAKAPGEGGCH